MKRVILIVKSCFFVVALWAMSTHLLANTLSVSGATVTAV